MKSCRIFFLLLAASLVLLPTSNLSACSDAKAGMEKMFGATNDEHCAALSDGCQETHPGQDCPPDTDGCGHCHCPGCSTTGMGAAGFFKNTFAIRFHFSVNGGTYFCFQAPNTSAHLAALFRPPIA